MGNLAKQCLANWKIWNDWPRPKTPINRNWVFLLHFGLKAFSPSFPYKAGITYQCFHTAAQSYPLGAEVDEKKFKVFFFDIGIAHRILGLDLAEWVTHPSSRNSALRGEEIFKYNTHQVDVKNL